MFGDIRGFIAVIAQRDIRAVFPRCVVLLDLLAQFFHAPYLFRLHLANRDQQLGARILGDTQLGQLFTRFRSALRDHIQIVGMLIVRRRHRGIVQRAVLFGDLRVEVAAQPAKDRAALDGILDLFSKVKDRLSLLFRRTRRDELVRDFELLLLGILRPHRGILNFKQGNLCLVKPVRFADSGILQIDGFLERG